MTLYFVNTQVQVFEIYGETLAIMRRYDTSSAIRENSTTPRDKLYDGM